MEVISKSVAIVIIMKIITLMIGAHTHTHCNTAAPQNKKEGHYYKLS